MSSRTGVLLWTVSVIGLGGTAHADENPYHDWSGLYVGVQAGGSWFDGTLSESGDFNTGVSLDDSSRLLGGFIGIQTQQGNLVFGAEADVGFFDLADRADFTGFRNATVTEEADWFASIRGRAGITSGPFLIYGTGGIGFLNQNLVYKSGFETLRQDKILTGWTLGAGMELAFGDGWSARAEYLHADFQSTSVTGTGLTSTTTTSTVDPSLDMVRIGLVKRF